MPPVVFVVAWVSFLSLCLEVCRSVHADKAVQVGLRQIAPVVVTFAAQCGDVMWAISMGWPHVATSRRHRGKN